MFMDFLGRVETAYKCSGLCSTQKLYLFSDINAGIPTQACGTDLKNNYVKATLGNYGAGCFVIGCLLLIPFLLHIPQMISFNHVWRNGAIFPGKYQNVI
jgi:hypothetical protein